MFNDDQTGMTASDIRKRERRSSLHTTIQARVRRSREYRETNQNKENMLAKENATFTKALHGYNLFCHTSPNLRNLDRPELQALY